jgi:hypothetical protein
MKTNLYYSAGIILLSLLFLSSINAINSAESGSQNFNPAKQFLITAMHSGADSSNINTGCNPDFSQNLYSILRDTLRFNAWHRYGCWFDNDVPLGNIGVISQGITNTLTQNNQHGLRTIFDRPISRYVCYGQRSDYECEKISQYNDYYFHSFKNSITNTYVSDFADYNFNGAGAKVKYCSFNAGGPGVWSGYIVKDLISNREQCNRVIDHTRDDIYDWYVKPRIRIDTAFANNPNNQEVKVCRIEMIDWNDNLVKSVDIRVKNFKNLNLRYLGDYIVEYYYLPYGDTANLNLSPTDLCPETSPMKRFNEWVRDTIKTDFRVFWYGVCEMYIDRIRVENLPAKQLFDRDQRLMDQIEAEVNLASNFDPTNPIPNNFYNEEFEFNMTPCNQELSKIIDSISQEKISLMVNINMDMYNVHIPNYEQIFEPADFKKYLLDNSKIKIILPNPYYLEGWEDSDTIGNPSKNPNTLPVYSHWQGIGYDISKGLLTYPASPAEYDIWLQNQLDDQPSYYNFKTVMKKYDEI